MTNENIYEIEGFENEENKAEEIELVAEETIMTKAKKFIKNNGIKIATIAVSTAVVLAIALAKKPKGYSNSIEETSEDRFIDAEFEDVLKENVEENTSEE